MSIPDMFNERGVQLKGGAVIPVAKVPSPGGIERHGAAVVNNPDERVLLDGHFYYSGEIPRVSAFRKGPRRSPLSNRPECSVAA